MKLYEPSTIRMIKKTFGFRFAKSLGQNFLIDGQVPEDIAEAAGIGPEDFVLEIGPGIGTLTAAAAARAGHVTSVEIDEDLLKVLAFTMTDYHNVNIVHGDILKQDIPQLIAREDEAWRQEKAGPGGADLPARSAEERRSQVKIVGNLPYYITTPIIMKLLESRTEADSITIMIQKEVAERIVSPPGSRVYGALSVAVQYYSEPVLVREVPRTAFMPAPKVDSAVIRMTLRREQPWEIADEGQFFRCVKAAFGQRRKTLLNSLQGTGAPKEQIRACLERAGIAENRRAETLGIPEFAALANAFSEYGQTEK